VPIVVAVVIFMAVASRLPTELALKPLPSPLATLSPELERTGFLRFVPPSRAVVLVLVLVGGRRRPIVPDDPRAAAASGERPQKKPLDAEELLLGKSEGG
jgi:hypothetical protein